TRPAALAVLVTQSVAVAKVHAKKGFSIMNGGFEFNLALMAIAAAMLVAGPGLFSVHEGIERLAEGRGARQYVRKVRPGRLPLLMPRRRPPGAAGWVASRVVTLMQKLVPAADRPLPMRAPEDLRALIEKHTAELLAVAGKPVMFADLPARLDQERHDRA